MPKPLGFSFMPYIRKHIEKYNHLLHKGLRRCWVCKNIKELKLFKKSKAKKDSGGYAYICNSCHIKDHPKVKLKISFLSTKELKCDKCGVENENKSFFDLDHIIPISKNKSLQFDRNNIQLLCPNCHRLKTLEDKVI